jgi:hypothetical protein
MRIDTGLWVPLLLLSLLLHIPSTVHGRPNWSWDVVPSYFHCANVSGEWNAETLKIIASKPFVVFEKNHKLFESPVGDEVGLSM